MYDLDSAGSIAITYTTRLANAKIIAPLKQQHKLLRTRLPVPSLPKENAAYRRILLLLRLARRALLYHFPLLSGGAARSSKSLWLISNKAKA